MEDVVNVLVAVAVIVFIVRWATSSNDTPAQRAANAALGFRPKNVTPEMVDTVQNMFPDIPRDNIRYDLLRTGNVQTTSNKILERGFLDAPPPAYFTVYPQTAEDGTTRSTNPPPPQPGARPAAPTKKPQENLISRLKLQDRIAPSSAQIEAEASSAGGKAVWEDTPEKREASLRERKAQMVLAARQRMLSKQQAAGKKDS